MTISKNSLFNLLLLTTAFDFVLLFFRLDYIGYNYGQIASIDLLIRYRGIPTFLFLGWNLFLAWIPYLISLLLRRDDLGRFALGGILVSWLLFFPNAPYIITDLLHLKHRPPIPMWFDVLLLFSFAWTGLILGFASLKEVEQFLQKRYNPTIAIWCVSMATVLAGFGVFVGRFQRWNTWDVLVHPLHLFMDMMEVLCHPIAHSGTFGLAIVMAGMLTLGYWTVRKLAG